jgi:hypothetical protein
MLLFVFRRKNPCVDLMANMVAPGIGDSITRNAPPACLPELLSGDSTYYNYVG